MASKRLEELGARVGAALSFVVLLAAWTRAQTTSMESLHTSGAQGDDNSSACSISGDGRFVAFHSMASNLVAGDTNFTSDIFVRDRASSTTVRISVSSTGTQGNNGSLYPSMSADGRFVSFAGHASNIVSGDTNNKPDVFVHDRQTGILERVSVSSSGAQGDGYSEFSSISGDGRYVAYQSYSSNLVPGDTNALADVFVRDRLAGTTERISVTSAGAEGSSYSEFPSITPDGRFVAFVSYATNLVPGDTNGWPDVFVRDRQLGLTERVSVDDFGLEGNSYSVYPAISADGRFVAFQSNASNLVPGDSNGTYDILVRDRSSATTELVTVDSGGIQASEFSVNPTISADGRYVAYCSYDNFLVPNDNNGTFDCFVRDRQSGTTVCVSVEPSGATGNYQSYYPALSSDGQLVVFYSNSTNLVGVDTNFATDVFVHDRGPLYPGTYCTSGTTTNGCTATISGTGTPSASSGSGFTIGVGAVEGQKQGLIFYGVDNAGHTPAPWGSGTSYLCVKSPTQRTGVQDSGGTVDACDGSFVIDWNAFIAAHPGALGQPFSAGQHVFAQAWFRDPPASKGTSFSDGLEFAVAP